MKFLYLVAVMLLLLMSACDISKPKMPTWNVELNVPLTSQRLFVSDLATGENIVITGVDSVLTLRGEGDAQTNPFGDVNYTPDVQSPTLPLVSGWVDQPHTVSIVDPAGVVFLSYGHLIQGNIVVNFSNMNPNATVTIKFPQVRDDAGNVLSIVDYGSSGQQNVSLTGYSIGTENSNVIVSELQILLTVSSPSSGVVGFVSLEMSNQLGFNYFQGRLNGYRRDFLGEIAPLDIEYPWGLEEAVQLEGAKLYLALTNEMGFDAEFHGEMYAKNNRTLQTRSIAVADTTAEGVPTPYIGMAATLEGPVVTNYIFTRNFSQLLEIMPDYVELRNAYLLINSHDDQIGFVDEHNRMHANYVVEAPLHLTLFDSVVRMEEPVRVEISEDNQKLIQDNIHGDTYLAFQVLNNIPLGGKATICVGLMEEMDHTDPSTYEFTKEITLLSSLAPGGDIWQPNEYNPVMELTLTEEELNVFANPEVFLLFTFQFFASDGPVTITADVDSFVDIRVMLNGTLRIQEDI